MINIGVIGAGMAGITCANYLFSKGFKVTVYEKSRGLGGRMATKRINSELSIDHGVQYINVNTPAFKKYLDQCISNGYAEHWAPSGMDAQYLNQNKIFVGVPGMSSLLKMNSKELNIKFSLKVENIKKIKEKWIVSFEDSELREQFDLLVFAIPPIQVNQIIQGEDVLLKELSTVEIDPCWSLILITRNKLNCNDYNKFYSNNIASIVYNSSKPKRNKLSNSYIIHSSPDWTNKNLLLERNEIELKIINILENQLNQKIEIEYIKAHRWLYAQTKVPLGKSFLKNKDSTLYIGGDWCLGANVQAAFNSGLEIAEFINLKFDK